MGYSSSIHCHTCNARLQHHMYAQVRQAALTFDSIFATSYRARMEMAWEVDSAVQCHLIYDIKKEVSAHGGPARVRQ